MKWREPLDSAVFLFQIGHSSLCSIVALTFPVASQVRARYILSCQTSVGISFHPGRCPVTTLLASTAQLPVRMLVFRVRTNVYIGFLRCTPQRCNVVARGTYFQVSYVLIGVDFAWHSLLWTPLPPPAPQTPLSIKCTLYGSSQTHGVPFVSLSNNDRVPITVRYLETLPALVTPWMHTITSECRCHRSRCATLISLGAFLHSVFDTDDLIYHPPLLLANGQHGPSTLQAALTIPAKSTLRLSVDLSKTFLKYTDPPDVMRGWDPPPAVLFSIPVRENASARRWVGRASRSGCTPQRPSSTFRCPISPYNVVILSCTLMIS